MTNEPLAPADPADPRYKRAARLLARKLGIDWRDLPAEQVNEYLRKIEIARAQADPPRPHNEGCQLPRKDDT